MLEPANHWARIDWTRMWWAESVDWKALAEKGTGLDEQKKMVNFKLTKFRI